MFIKTLLFVMAFLLIQDCWFVVQPSELAGLRRLGRVITAEPLAPGWYFKIPLVDTIDTLQVSINTFKLESLTVYTVDNQSVTISVSMTYRIPKRGVLKLLYEVGRSGAFDIDENIYPITSDRIMRVFAKTNTTKISEQRDTIGQEIKTLVTQSLNEMFAVEVIDLQISAIKYSQTFEASVEAAVKAKNEAIAAENTVRRVQYEGEQQIVAAKAAANVLLTQAEADKAAKVLAAEGEARAIILQGEARAQSLRLQAAALNGATALVEFTKAERWSGQLPNTVLGEALPILNLDSK